MMVTKLIPLFTIIPNIRCLRITLGSIPTFESSLWSSIVLPYLVEFRLWAESSLNWSIEDLIIFLHLMPALKLLLLNLLTTDIRLLDGRQVRAAISAAKIMHLDEFSYGVEYTGKQFECNLIINLPQTWLPQPIALTFNEETREILLHTIPCVFHRFWTRKLLCKTEIPVLKQNIVSSYGDGAYITRCHAYAPWEFSELCTVLKKSSHVEHLTLWLPSAALELGFGKYPEMFSKEYLFSQI